MQVLFMTPGIIGQRLLLLVVGGRQMKTYFGFNQDPQIF
jgi:hypothetical protein